MKQKFEEYKSQQQQGRGSQHWFDARQGVFQEAVQEWNSLSSPTSLARKRHLSAEARKINAEANNARGLALADYNEAQRGLTSEKRKISDTQLDLVKSAIADGLLCPQDQGRSEPSIFKPIQLASFAAEQEIKSSSGSNSQIACTVGLNSPDAHSNVLELLEQQPSSLHGLGDDKFAISEAIMSFLCDQKAFVSQTHSQFNLEQGSVCDKIPYDLEIDESKSIDKMNSILSCEQILGRFCKSDIADEAKYTSALGMLKNIVRVMKSHRSVKQGNTMHLGMDTPFPVILLRHGSTVYGWLATRLCFKPLEIDFIRCDLEMSHTKDFAMPESEYTEQVRLRPKFSDAAPGSSRLLPCADTMQELSVWYSQQNGNDWMCDLYLEYDLDPQRPVSLLLKADQVFASSTISLASFEQQVATQRRTTRGQDSADEFGLADANKLIKRIQSSNIKNTPSGSGSTQKTSCKRSQTLPLLNLEGSHTTKRRALFLFVYILCK